MLEKVTGPYYPDSKAEFRPDMVGLVVISPHEPTTADPPDPIGLPGVSIGLDSQFDFWPWSPHDAFVAFEACSEFARFRERCAAIVPADPGESEIAACLAPPEYVVTEPRTESGWFLSYWSG